MAKSIKIEFYRVTMPENAPAFDTILAAITRLPNNERRTRSVGGRHVRLREIRQADGIWEGDITRIRMTEVPGKASLDGDFEPFEFEDDEGIGEETAFLYHARTRVLAIQYNHFGATPSLFARYMEAIGGIEGLIDFQPAINPNVITRLANMEVYRSIEIGLAGLDNSALLGQQGRSLGVHQLGHRPAVPRHRGRPAARRLGGRATGHAPVALRQPQVPGGRRGLRRQDPRGHAGRAHRQPRRPAPSGPARCAVRGRSPVPALRGPLHAGGLGGHRRQPVDRRCHRCL